MDSEMVKLQYKEYDYTIKFLKILAKFNCWYRIDLTEIGSSFVFSLSFERLMVCFLFLSDKTNISPDKSFRKTRKQKINWGNFKISTRPISIKLRTKYPSVCDGDSSLFICPFVHHSANIVILVGTTTLALLSNCTVGLHWPHGLFIR